MATLNCEFRQSSASDILNFLHYSTDKSGSFKHFFPMRSQVQFIGEVFSCAMQAHVVTVAPESTLRNVVDFSLIRNIGGFATFAVILL